MGIRPNVTPLATRLIVAFVAITLVAALAAGAPAYWLIRSELERQAWSRVEDGHRVTGRLIDAESARLADLVRLTSERPTLQRLMMPDGIESLPAYLETIHSTTNLDFLTVTNLRGQTLAGTELAEVQDRLNRSDIVILESGQPGQPGQPALVTTRRVIIVETGEQLGYVTGGVLIDDEFMAELKAETGLDQSMLIGGERIATSLQGAERNPPSALFVAIQTNGISSQRATSFGALPYYTVLSPLNSSEGEALAVLETALPVSSMVDARERALTVLGISTLGVGIIGSLMGVLLARRLSAPLRALTGAAQTISAGDYITPVPKVDGAIEIVTLAGALEESRHNTQRTLNELSLAKAWSDNLIGSINEGVVTFDTRGLISYFSEGAERILGIPREAALGKTVERVFRLLEDDRGDGFLARIPPRGGKQEIGVMRQDGRGVTLAVTGARLVPPHGDEVQVVLVFRDVTEEEASRNLRIYFLANITHEFRTPLAALSASIELLMDEAEHLNQPNLNELTGSLYLSVVNLRTLIDNLLESSSIEAGRFIIRRRVIDLNEVVGEAVQVVQPLLTRRQQRLVITEPVRLFRVEADPSRILQVLINLLSNASKYSPPDSEIGLSIEVRQSDLRVRVADRGSGIAAADRAGLFQRFMRVGTSSAEQYGIGLGLSVAKAIIDGHGGEIGVDARDGGGSVFWFTLPLGNDFSAEVDV